MRSAEGGAPYKTIPLVFSGFADARRAPLQCVAADDSDISGQRNAICIYALSSLSIFLQINVDFFLIMCYNMITVITKGGKICF